MLATMTGLSSPGRAGASPARDRRGACPTSTIPQIAPAARVRICLEMRLRPATSTMLGNITMSFTPTYCAVLPLARVETITLGKPIGSARFAAVLPSLQRGQVGPARGRNLVAFDVGLQVRFAQRADVDDQRPVSAFFD